MDKEKLGRYIFFSTAVVIAGIAAYGASKDPFWALIPHRDYSQIEPTQYTEQLPERLRKYDSNKDGVIDAKEASILEKDLLNK